MFVFDGVSDKKYRRAQLRPATSALFIYTNGGDISVVWVFVQR